MKQALVHRKRSKWIETRNARIKATVNRKVARN